MVLTAFLNYKFNVSFYPSLISFYEFIRLLLKYCNEKNNT